jgi:uncharacterized protein YciI
MYRVVLVRAGPSWRQGEPLEAQSAWEAHAAFMDDLVARGVVVLGGPLADEHRVVLAIEVASEDAVRSALSADPWAGSHLVLDSLERWTIRLDARNI